MVYWALNVQRGPEFVFRRDLASGSFESFKFLYSGALKIYDSRIRQADNLIIHIYSESKA
jgi:hypothetical protein